MIFPDRVSLADITPDMYAEARNYYNRVEGEDYIPVLVPVKNGVATLGATLLALSKSKEPTLPIIIDNDSTDATPDIAQKFGVPYIEQRNGSKVAAVQTGLRYAAQTLMKGEVLITDADALYQPATSKIMRRQLKLANPELGMGLLGSSVFSGGLSRTADNLYTTLRLVKDVSRIVRSKQVSPRGHNYGIAFDTNGKILFAIERLDESIFVGDAHAILDAVKDAGGEIKVAYHHATIVNAHADRVGSVKDVIEKIFTKTNELESYRKQYGSNFTIYDRKT